MVSFFVPALNEEKNIENTIDDIIDACRKAHIKEIDIIIANDGSSDGTRQIIETIEEKYKFIQSFHNTQNKGLGYCFKKALLIAKYSKFFFIAGDNDMPADVILNILENRNKADLVFVYFLNKELRGRRRNVISTIYGIIYTIIFNIYVQYINGGVLYSTDRLRQISLKSDRFSIIIEATIKMLKTGCSFYEVGGYMQRGLDGSSSISLKNLIDVIYSFLRLWLEVKIVNRKIYCSTPHRIK
ncbi:MAG: hypothetical protein CVV44_23000 [Spirochaetae bacterium HGW-Spirochaetae-1]|jgi:glycosyltransferase involved in cell wall biosynthesis|nr:MAG: hypothetical protein CVV44_23000 [Spirochaetae bacterium HGW-Spirochaetae-1]